MTSPVALKLKSSRHLFWGLLAIFIFLRLLPVFTAVERISHYDELDLGVIGTELTSSVRLPLWFYQMDPYGGESLVLGALSIPFLKILGTSLFAVKMPPLIFAILLFILAWIFLSRNFGSAQAIRGALLLIFAPPSFVQFSLAALSGHAEAIVISLASFIYFYDFMYGSQRKPSLFLFAVFSGFGFWFYHANVIVTLTCLLCIVLQNRRVLAKPSYLLVLSGGILCGLLPWLGYISYYGKSGLSFLTLGTHFLIQNFISLKATFEKISMILLKGIPLSFAFFPAFGIDERFLSFLYFCIAYLPIIGLLLTGGSSQEIKNRKLLPLVLFPIVFIVVLTLSFFGIDDGVGYIGFRYLAPLQFYFLLLTAPLLHEGKIRKLIFTLILSAGFLGQTALMFREPAGQAIRYQGDSYHRVGTQWAYTLTPRVETREDFKKVLLSRTPTQAYFLLWGIADAGMARQDVLLLADVPALPLNETIPHLPENAASYLYEWSGSLAEDKAAFLELYQKTPEKFHGFLSKGFFEAWIGAQFSNGPEALREINAFSTHQEWAYRAAGKFFVNDLNALRDVKLPELQKSWLYEGLALASLRIAWDSNVLFQPSVEKVLSQLNSEEQPPFYRGLGWVVRAMFREDRRRGLDWLETFPEEGKNAAMLGFTSFEEWYEIPA